jgi:hypothetical protein
MVGNNRSTTLESTIMPFARKVQQVKKVVQMSKTIENGVKKKALTKQCSLYCSGEIIVLRTKRLLSKIMMNNFEVSGHVSATLNLSFSISSKLKSKAEFLLPNCTPTRLHFQSFFRQLRSHPTIHPSSSEIHVYISWCGGHYYYCKINVFACDWDLRI